MPAGKDFTPLESLPQDGRPASRPSSLQMKIRGSKFVRFQEVKIMELPSEVRTHLAWDHHFHAHTFDL